MLHRSLTRIAFRGYTCHHRTLFSLSGVAMPYKEDHEAIISLNYAQVDSGGTHVTRPQRTA